MSSFSFLYTFGLVFAILAQVSHYAADFASARERDS